MSTNGHNIISMRVQMVTKERNDVSIRVPMSESEQIRFREYVEENGLNIGKFVRKLIVEKMNESQEATNG